MIFDNEANAVILDSIHNPVAADFFWVLDLKMQDFTLAPLLVLEEITGPAITVDVNGFHFKLPAMWNLLVFDPETHQLDVVTVEDLPGKQFTALMYGPEMKTHQAATITALDYHPHTQCIAPSLAKHQMMCHPVAPNAWINASPSDVYTKYLREFAVGDII